MGEAQIMAQQQVTNEEFIDRLGRLFESSSKAHSVFVTHKRVSQTGTGSAPHSIVVRATDGRGKASSGRTKFTTHVEADKLNAFQDAYSALLRASTAAFLRKRDKAKERRVDKMVKEKRRKLEETTKDGTGTAAGTAKVTKIGSKRGAGRRKRQQAQKKARSVRRERARMHVAAAKATSATAGAGQGGA